MPCLLRLVTAEFFVHIQGHHFRVSMILGVQVGLEIKTILWLTNKDSTDRVSMCIHFTEEDAWQRLTGTLTNKLLRHHVTNLKSSMPVVLLTELRTFVNRREY
jgi:hypothetical protein